MTLCTTLQKMRSQECVCKYISNSSLSFALPSFFNCPCGFNQLKGLIGLIIFFFVFIDEEVPQTEESITSDKFHLLSSEKLTGIVLICQHFFALYVKRFCNSKRNLKGFFCEVLCLCLHNNFMCPCL